jgi:hypothetical protein
VKPIILTNESGGVSRLLRYSQILWFADECCHVKPCSLKQKEKGRLKFIFQTALKIEQGFGLFYVAGKALALE